MTIFAVNKTSRDMKIEHYDKASVAQVNANTERRIIYTKDLLTAIVDFSGGPEAQPQPFHQHPHEQTSYVAHGEVLFCTEGNEPVHLKAGDMFAVSPNEKHSIQLLTHTARLIDNFNPVREDFIKP
jgi:quercetin dioxygenase-like cupin family protein